jgi:outer membrane lipoprotein-sorting protein
LPEFLHDVLRAFLMRRPHLFLLPVLMVLLSGAGQPAILRAIYNEQQKADLDKVSAYLNSIHSLKADFVQIGPDGGVSQGELAILKPGQMRFAFHPPSPMQIVATGGAIYVKNSRLNTVDHYALSDTPLGLLLNQDLDLKNNRSVLGVYEQNDALIVQARSALNQNRSNITLVFSQPTLELRQWIVKDNQGGNTTVALGNLQIGAEIDPAIFTVPVKDPRPAQGRN